MENFLTLLIPAVLALLLAKAIALPVRLGLRLLIHAFFGFLCLWILNLASGLTGLRLPINAATVLISGCLGFPGIGLIALLELAV